MLRKFHVSKDAAILDYGAGKIEKWSEWNGYPIRKAGYRNVILHDIGNNAEGNLITPDAIRRDGGLGALDFYRYDVIMLSNVLNVLPDADTIGDVLLEVEMLGNGDSAFVIMNYPLSPRNSRLGANVIKNLIENEYSHIFRIGGSERAPVWICFE
jgi:hypothetical protein